MSSNQTPESEEGTEQAFQESQTVLPDEQCSPASKACTNYWLPVALAAFSIGVGLGLAAGRYQGKLEGWHQAKKWWNSTAKSVSTQVNSSIKQARRLKKAQDLEQTAKALRSKLGI